MIGAGQWSDYRPDILVEIVNNDPHAVSDTAVDESGGANVPKQRSARALPIWEQITLMPNPLPEIDESHVDLRCRVLSHNLSMPVMIEPDGSRSSARPIAL